MSVRKYNNIYLDPSIHRDFRKYNMQSQLLKNHFSVNSTMAQRVTKYLKWGLTIFLRILHDLEF